MPFLGAVGFELTTVILPLPGVHDTVSEPHTDKWSYCNTTDCRDRFTWSCELYVYVDGQGH